MANLKSSLKDIRRIAKSTVRNRGVRSRLKSLQKNLQTAIDGGEDAASTKEAATAYISALDKAAKRNIIHPNKASRHKSACATYLK